MGEMDTKRTPLNGNYSPAGSLYYISIFHEIPSYYLLAKIKKFDNNKD